MSRSYKEILEFLYHFTPAYHKIGSSAFKPGLEKTYQLDAYFESPHKQFFSVHVGGTNGKGSVSHALSAIFQQAGYKVGLYTSPHLIDFVERIKINGQNAPHSWVIDFVEKHSSIIFQVQPSFFEFTTFMAFEYFKQQKVDIAIIEVGMGGRLDTTNVITPVLSIITNVSYDHQMFLGNTLEKIASEKAGIIKKGISVIVGEHHPETDPIFIQKANETQTSLIFAEDYFEWQVIEQDFQYQTIKNLKNNQIYKTDLIGNYQLKNLKTILKATEVLEYIFPKISQKVVQQALTQTKKLSGFKGRMEFLRFQDKQFLIDTAHNIAGITELIRYLENFPKHNLHFILGFVNDKDIEQILPLFPKEAYYYFTQPHVERAFNAEILKEKAQTLGLQGNHFTNFEEIINSLKAQSANDLVIVCGSCFLVGDFLGFIKTRGVSYA